ncbi:MAG TPA: hypothetical protein VHC39_15955 [Rhizomicrobium sp.]|nr:hypothetical protein [Rhizomicrobium sp.]
MAEIADLLSLTLSALFAATAILHVLAPSFVRRWEFGRGFYAVFGVAQALTALFLAVPQTRIWGGILGAMILFVTVISLLNQRNYAFAVPAILVLAALAPAMA